MITAVSKWGNSLAIRIPKILLNTIDVKEMDNVDVSVIGNQIVITKAIPSSIKELFEAYDGQPSISPEVDWGEVKGDEIW